MPEQSIRASSVAVYIIPKITARAWAAAMMYISEVDSEFPDRPVSHTVRRRATRAMPSVDALIGRTVGRYEVVENSGRAEWAWSTARATSSCSDW